MKISSDLNQPPGDGPGRGGLSGFCPDHLAIAGREELSVFPLNILFAKFRGEPDGSQTMGSALYLPDIPSFKREKGEWSMTYRNQYGAESYVVITIRTAGLSYRGEKFVGGILVGTGAGKIEEDAHGRENGWADFFFHLTLLRLSPGEPCRFEHQPLPRELRADQGPGQPRQAEGPESAGEK